MATVTPQFYAVTFAKETTVTPQFYAITHVEERTKSIVDLERNVESLSENAGVDLEREVKEQGREDSFVDILRKVTGEEPEESAVDLVRKLVEPSDESAAVDLVRRINVITDESAAVDLEREVNVELIENSGVDLARCSYVGESDSVDLFRDVSLNESHAIDLARRIPHMINVRIKPDGTPEASVDGDTGPIFIPPHHDPIGETYTFQQCEQAAGLTAIDISMVEADLTDALSFSTAGIQNELLQEYHGTYLDYEYSVMSEQVKADGIRQDVQCAVDRDITLNQTYRYKGYDLEPWESEERKVPWSARKHVETIAGMIGKSAYIRLDDFTLENNIEDSSINLQSVMSNLFSWTLLIPTMAVMSFIRGGTLYVVQRGNELQQYTIDGLDYTRPIITKSILRTDRFDWDDVARDGRLLKEGTYSEDFWKEPTERLNPGQRHSTHSTQNTYDDDWNITKKVVQNDDGTITTIEYEYETNGRKKYLKKQTETTQRRGVTTTDESGVNVDRGGEVVDVKVTDYEYDGAGQYTAVRSDGDGNSYGYGGAGAGYGRKSNTITDWDKGRPEWVNAIAVQAWQRVYNNDAEYYVSAELERIRSLFPVSDKLWAIQLAHTYENMNLWTEESVTMDIYGFDHVLSFTDRISFNGNLYFLRSNSVHQDTRIVNRQSVELVRWYP